jgi:Ca-activated chloride channel homolog
MEDWFSSNWFSIARLMEITWARPYVLYSLLGIPLLFFLRNFIQNKTLAGLPIATLKGKISLGWTRHLRLLGPILFGMSLVLFIIALARPQLASNSKNRFSEGIDIILAIDISESMLNKDILPNRLEASKKIAKQFVNNRFQDRIGIVIFSGEAYSLSPLTSDYQALDEYINEINPSLIKKEGTAIGTALAVSVSRLIEAKSKTKIVILISDGDNTAGNLDPGTSAQLAKAYGVKLYTILVGSISKNISKDSALNNYNRSIDTEVLNEIAKTAEGKFFRAVSSNNLKTVFDQINKLEKIQYLENSSQELIDVFSVYLKWGIVFLLLAYGTKITFLGNILED